VRDEKNTGRIWNGIELCIDILEILLNARETGKIGASGKTLEDSLQIDVADLIDALHYLYERELVQSGERVITITDKGVRYLLEQRPDR
jgi:hypothetical protein